MKPKVAELLHRAAAGHLAPGERIEVALKAQISTVSFARNMAVAAAVAVASGGAGSVVAMKTPVYLVLTNWRLLLLDAHSVTGRPVDTLRGAYDRRAVYCSEPQGAVFGIGLKADLAFSGRSDGLSLLIPAPEKQSGRAFAAALPRF
ncbi:hypothetical protein GCM10022221_28680 [Actinocorallia aurea]